MMELSDIDSITRVSREQMIGNKLIVMMMISCCN